MAQTRKRRRRKHRGTQGGSLDRRATGRPRSREEARARAKRNSQLKRDLAPTWGGAFKRGLIGAVVFFVVLLILKQPASGALMLSAVMLGMYVPLGYYIDRFFYRRRLMQARREALARKQQQQRR